MTTATGTVGQRFVAGRDRRSAASRAGWLAAWIGAAALWAPALLFAANQTDTVSPIVVGGRLPYGIELRTVDFGEAPLPTLQSFVAGEHDGKWALLAGRTNGLHELRGGGGGGGLLAFPPSFQNREIWVIDPVTRESWHRSLEDEVAAGNLTTAQVDALTPTNGQFYQRGDRLYMVGGYGYDRTESRFRTYDTLTAFDLPGVIDWVRDTSGSQSIAQHMRQIHDPLLQVTGGAMARIGETTHLVFGQNFDGPYRPGRNGEYTKQVRSFNIIDDGVSLSLANVRQTPPVDAYRRRDLNIVPVLRRDAATGQLEEGLVAFSGFFTPSFGAWTVPVEIDSDGTPHMANPTAPETFKQGMNGYHSAKLGLFSQNRDEMHTVLFGGISLQYYDRDAGQFVTDPNFPFINQFTSIVTAPDGSYRQYLLDEEFPEFYDDAGQRLLFGSNAEFMLAEGVAAYENGVIAMDRLSEPTRLGYIFGGIVADRGNRGNTVASNLMFEVLYTPVPEPQSLTLATGLLLALAAGGYRAHRGRRRRAGVDSQPGFPIYPKTESTAIRT